MTVSKSLELLRGRNSLVHIRPKVVSTTGSSPTITVGLGSCQTTMHTYKDKGIVCLSYRSEFEVMRNCCVPQLRYAIRNRGLSNCRHSWTLKDGGREGIQTPVG